MKRGAAYTNFHDFAPVQYKYYTKIGLENVFNILHCHSHKKTSKMEKFCAEIIRRATHQTLASAGFEKSSRIGGDVLADVFKEYLMFLGKSAQEAATNAGRTKVNTTDILVAFEDLGINLEELREWAKTEGKVLGGYAGRKPTLKGIT